MECVRNLNGGHGDIRGVPSMLLHRWVRRVRAKYKPSERHSRFLGSKTEELGSPVRRPCQDVRIQPPSARVQKDLPRVPADHTPETHGKRYPDPGYQSI